MSFESKVFPLPGERVSFSLIGVCESLPNMIVFSLAGMRRGVFFFMMLRGVFFFYGYGYVERFQVRECVKEVCSSMGEALCL